MKNDIAMSFTLNEPRFELDEVLQSVDKFSDFLSLPPKKAIHLRLLSEELINLPKVLLDTNECELVIKSLNDRAELSLKVHTGASEKARELLLNTSSKHENAAYSGFTGIIRKALDAMCAPSDIDPYDSLAYSDMQSMRPITYNETNYEWSLERYRREAQLEKRAEEYDALELSVLAKLSDDITVYLRPQEIEIKVEYTLS